MRFMACCTPESVRSGSECVLHCRQSFLFLVEAVHFHRDFIVGDIPVHKEHDTYVRMVDMPGRKTTRLHYETLAVGLLSPRIGLRVSLP